MTRVRLFALPNMMGGSLANGVEVADEVLTGDMKVMSFNVRRGTTGDGENLWVELREFQTDIVKTCGPALPGTPETIGFRHGFPAGDPSGPSARRLPEAGVSFNPLALRRVGVDPHDCLHGDFSYLGIPVCQQGLQCRDGRLAGGGPTFNVGRSDSPEKMMGCKPRSG